MIVIPEHARTLIHRVVVLGLIWSSAWIEHGVVQETNAMAAVGSKPGEWSAITDPRHQTSMKVHCGAILRSVRAHNRSIDWNDVFRWKLVVESELDGRAPLRNNDAAEM